MGHCGEIGAEMILSPAVRNFIQIRALNGLIVSPGWGRYSLCLPANPTLPSVLKLAPLNYKYVVLINMWYNASIHIGKAHPQVQFMRQEGINEKKARHQLICLRDVLVKPFVT